MYNENFQVGFARVDVTPSIDTPIIGYYIERRSEGVLDNLEANAVAFKAADKTAVIISVDNCGLSSMVLDKVREKINAMTGVDKDAVFIHSTHTHTGPGPSLTFGGNDPKLIEYMAELERKIADAAYLAVSDLKPARLGYGIGKAERVAFVRRFRMKDGSVMTNPGVNNPDILEPIGEVDERVNVIRIDRENAETVVIANFGNHPDTVGGSKISADWPGFVRKFVEKAIDNTKCVFFNGAQGDVNHVNVHPNGGDFNDMFNDFDGCSRGYGHARHIGRVVAGAVMQVYDKVCYTDIKDIDYAYELIDIPANVPTKEQLPLARKYLELHRAGKDDQIPYKGMMLTTVVSEAKRMLNLEHGPEFFTIPQTALRIGDIAFMGFSGEPFTGIGRATKQTEGYDLILPCCCTNGSTGYFPMKDAYDEGGYEARASRYKAGVAELVTEKAVNLLKKIR
ncbi:MAG: neutral/alkaline non-lysosomal ceramidase N-terminal domain-containing protein [Clostridia bacterium]|nr:neutral/alkaline non-lysosomal ceramidase N-terminal domain-containing protein [Clostridia bacterium]